MAAAASRIDDRSAPGDGGSPIGAAIALARRLDPILNLFVEIAAGAEPPRAGPLAGLPLAVKDLVDLAGRAPTLGLARAPGPAPASTAPVLARLREAGAGLVGFTAMTPLAYEPSGGNGERGRTANPWSADYICGGSSSGSAVAVATGIVPVALGSDTAGSLRIPAHCCGVTAWKPTNGLVPVEGTMPLAPSLDTIGFLARSATDLLPIADLFPTPASPIRSVAVAQDLVPSLDPAIAAALMRVAAVLREAEIAVLATDIAPLIAACDSPVLDLLQGEAARVHRAAIASGALEPILAARLTKGEAISEDRLEACRAELNRLGGEALDAAFGGADAILLPVMRIPTPKVVTCEPAMPGFSARTLYALSALTRFANGLGLPVVAVPAGIDSDGMPIAMQIVGRRGMDRALLGLADTLQRATDWHLREPSSIAALSSSQSPPSLSSRPWSRDPYTQRSSSPAPSSDTAGLWIPGSATPPRDDSLSLSPPETAR